MAPDIVVFSKKRWDALSAADQQIIAEAARESVGAMRGFWKEREDLARKTVASGGCTFVRDIDKTSFQRAMQPVYNKFVVSSEQRALLQAIQSTR